jgi:peptidase E
MAARIVHLGAEEPAVVEEVREGGRIVVAGGTTFELHELTGRFVRQGDPYYGVRLVLEPS